MRNITFDQLPAITAEMQADIQEIKELLTKLSEKKSGNAPLRPATREQVSAHLGISFPTLRQLINSGQLKSFKLGRQIRIRWEDVELYQNHKGAK